MAAEIKPVNSELQKDNTKKMKLLSKIENSSLIKFAVFLFDGKTKGVISACDDKSVRIWLCRDTGQYWPSVCSFLPSPPTSLHYNSSNKLLFVGMENGTITEYEVAPDGNSIDRHRDYLAHTAHVSDLLFSIDTSWILSASKDKSFTFHCTATGRRLGGHQSGSWCTAIAYDVLSQHVFVGDYTGTIFMIKLTDDGIKFITELKGHSGSVQCLSWDPLSKLLFSGSYDQIVLVWDVGGGKGAAYELHGHTNKISSIMCVPNHQTLISGGEDSTVIFWNLAIQREQTPSWNESDCCQNCNRPFFWNFKAMVDRKQFGIRQHHCRKCGIAVCDTCSNNRCSIPILGFEKQVRLCDKCYPLVKENNISYANFQEVKHSIAAMDFHEKLKLLLTIGSDGYVKLWDLSDIFL